MDFLKARFEVSRFLFTSILLGPLVKTLKRVSNFQFQDVQEKIWKEAGTFALVSRTKAVINRYSKISPRYDLKPTHVNIWKSKCKKNK